MSVRLASNFSRQGLVAFCGGIGATLVPPLLRWWLGSWVEPVRATLLSDAVVAMERGVDGLAWTDGWLAPDRDQPSKQAVL